MNISDLLANYGPYFALALWFGYKWWNSRKVQTLLPSLRAQGAVCVDVRAATEFAGASAPGTINIPLPELGKRLNEVPKGVPIIVCCASGSRSGMAKLLLQKAGYAEVHNIGSWSKLMA